MWKLIRMSLHCFSIFFSPSLISEQSNQVCEWTLSCWRLSSPGIYEDASAFSLMIVYYVHTKLGSAGNGVGGERFDVQGDLGSMSEIQQQLAVLSRQRGQLATRFTDSERQRAEEAATAAAIQAAQKTEEERRKGQEVQEWNARMSSLRAVQIAMERKSATTTAAGRLSTAEEKKQEQGEAAGDFQPTGPSGGPRFRRELTRRGLLDRLGQSNSARRSKDPFDCGQSDFPVEFGSSVEDRNHSDDDDLMGESDFGVLKGVKWQIPIFDGTTTSWRRFEMEFLMAIRHLRLDSVLSGDKEEVPVADRTISRDRFNAHFGKSKVAKHSAVWSLISSSLKTDADKRVFFSTKSPVAGWERIASFHRAETQGAKLLLNRKVLSARLQPGKDPAIVVGEIVELLAALDEVGILVHEEFLWLHFVDNLPPGYEFIKNNLQGSKEPLTRTVIEDALQSRYSVQSGGKKEKTISDSALFVSGSKTGQGVGRGGGRGGTYKGKLDSRGRSEGLPSQAMTCNNCQKPGHFRPNCPKRQCFECQGWGHEAVSCPSKVSTPNKNGG